MTINKCEKCPYIKNVLIEYGDTILYCGKSNKKIIVSLKDHKTLKNKCPIESYKVESKPQESVKYCDRNICISNEYNGIGCEDCEVNNE